MAVFGDSYSDIHNVYELSKHTWPLPNFYYNGRFSDGLMWPEYVRGPYLGCTSLLEKKDVTF